MTNKEHILALREAYVNGYKDTLGCANTELCYTCKLNIVDAKKRAKEKYSLPMKTVPRELYAGQELLRINTITSGEVVEFKRINGEWEIYLTAEAFKVIKDLISNPTEEVEDDS